MEKYKAMVIRFVQFVDKARKTTGMITYVIIVMQELNPMRYIQIVLLAPGKDK